MTTLGGGSVAAYGLKYQYLATVEYFLRYLRLHPELIARTTLVVEPLFKNANEADDDIVDFAIELDDVAVHHIQVKATTKPDQYPIQPADARAALNQLLGHPADNSTLLTNKPLSPGLASESALAHTPSPALRTSRRPTATLQPATATRDTARRRPEIDQCSRFSRVLTGRRFSNQLSRAVNEIPVGTS
jgi:hypothetical protein